MFVKVEVCDCGYIYLILFDTWRMMRGYGKWMVCSDVYEKKFDKGKVNFKFHLRLFLF